MRYNKTVPQISENIVEFDNLRTSFFTDSGEVKAVDGVSFAVPRGRVVALVGESGCGKSVTSLSLMRLLQEPAGRITGGSIFYNAADGSIIDIARASQSLMQTIRGNRISMIFQEPMTSLNPVFTIGFQLDEVIRLHRSALSVKEARRHSVGMLESVGIARAQKTCEMYPHELSGGMRQRVMIAMALSCDPELLIADEPTTALDVTIQAQILDILRKIQKERGASILLITHDLGVVAEIADLVAVMYAGRIIEQGSALDVFKNPAHPYTRALLQSRPRIGQIRERLCVIPGQVPDPADFGARCRFMERCGLRAAVCEGSYPQTLILNKTHSCACYRARQVPDE